MATEQVADGVHRSSDGIVNWYLLEEDGELTIVDTGWPRSWPDVGRAVQSIGRRLEDVRSVVLTHGHADHMGAAEEARRNLSVPVRAHHMEIPRLKGQKRGGSSWALVPRLLPQLWRPSAFAFVLHAARHGFTGVDAGILLPGHGEPWRGELSQAVALAREADTG